MRIYVASSWRNAMQPEVVRRLREAGHEVYDFRNPAPGDDGFAWSEIDPDWQKWTPAAFVEALEHPTAQHGFRNDMDALQTAEATVLILPCGRSAHLELGYAVAADQFTAVLMPPGNEPELMYKMVDAICLSLDALVDVLRDEEEAWKGFSVK